MFLRNQWYVAAFSDEIEHKLLSRTLLNEAIILYRKQDGSPVAMQDQCPHRFLPLSEGKLVGDQVQCGYHGICFNADGSCARVPSQDRIPPRAQVKTYPVVDKFGLTWLWYGDESLADESEISDFDSCFGLRHHEDATWASCRDYFKPQASMSLVVDNLLDLSHIVYVHSSSFGSEDINDATMESEVGERSIIDRRSAPNSKPGPAFVGLVGDENTDVDFWMDMHWQAPGNLVLEFGVTAPGKSRDEGFQWIASHLLTPETDGSTHYFWVVSRAFDLDNDQLTQIWHDTVYAAFEEDDAILERQQLALGGRDLLDKKPIILGADKSALLARRINSSLLNLK